MRATFFKAAAAIACAGSLLIYTPDGQAQAAASGTAQTAASADYPTRPIRLVVPSAAGGGTDIVARLIAQKLSASLGQQVFVDNRPGAGQMIGIDQVAKASPDGYTLLMAASTLALNPAMYKTVPYDTLRDLAPISEVASLPNVLVVHPSVPANSLPELLALAKAQPGKLTYASAGVGTSPHMSMELLKDLARVDILHVPYKGTGPALVDVVAGQVAMMMGNTLSVLPHIKSGKLRALGVSGTTRSAALPDVPTLAEGGVARYESVQWYGLLAPAGTPVAIINKLHTTTVSALGDADLKKHLAADGAEPVGNSPDAFGALIRSEITKWKAVAAAAGITPE